MAHTHSPIRSVDESPSGATGRRGSPSTLMSAMSVSGSAPMRCACRLRPSDSLTVMRPARSMTWLFVRMLPSESMMKPVPAPRRGASRSSRGVPKPNGPSNSSGGSGTPARERRRRVSLPWVVASVFTTAGLIRSTTSAKLTSAAGATPPDGRAAAWTSTLLAPLPAATEARGRPPVRMAPTRNATTAVSTTVTRVKRRDISVFNYKLQKRVLIQRFNAELSRLFELAAGVASRHDITRFLAHGPGHARAEAFERFGRLLAAHRRERAGEDEDLAGQWSRIMRRLRRSTDHVDAGLGEPDDELAVAGLVGKCPHRRGHNRSDFGHRLQRLGRRLHDTLHRPEIPREGRRRFLSDVTDSEGVDQAREVVLLAALDLIDDVPADLAELSRPRAFGPRLARRDHEVFEP